MEAEEVKQLRARMRLTQKEFGGRLGLDAITISRWELGRQKPKPDNLRKLERLMRRGNDGL